MLMGHYHGISFLANNGPDMRPTAICAPQQGYFTLEPPYIAGLPQLFLPIIRHRTYLYQSKFYAD